MVLDTFTLIKKKKLGWHPDADDAAEFVKVLGQGLGFRVKVLGFRV